MKLNTLLLASAATLIASSAFAADLPSKKAAPAAGSVQVCKVGGMTGFTLPGSDTCLQISGRVTVDYHNADLEDSDTFYDGSVLGEDGGVGYRLNFDARSNSELGVVRGFVSLTDVDATYARKAYIQVGGFTAGLKDSIADIAGTQGEIFASGWGQSGTGVDYITNVGGLTLGIGAEDNNDSGGYYSETPDMILHLAGKAGDIGFKVAAVSHDAGSSGTGYALLGHVDATFGALTAFAFAGTSESAANYTWSNGGSCEDDYDAESMSYGGGLTIKAGAATSVTVQGRHAECGDTDFAGTEYSNDSVGIVVQHQLAKNLSIEPEYVYSTDENDNTTSQLFVRIKRDF